MPPKNKEIKSATLENREPWRTDEALMLRAVRGGQLEVCQSLLANDASLVNAVDPINDVRKNKIQFCS
jgi:hypothetical protein